MLTERLKKARKSNRLTQEGLAKKVNSTKGTISNYENGHSTPSNEMLIELSKVLDVSTDYLLGRSDNKDINSNEFTLAQEDLDPEILEMIEVIKTLPEDEREKVFNVFKAMTTK